MDSSKLFKTAKTLFLSLTFIIPMIIWNKTLTAVEIKILILKVLLCPIMFMPLIYLPPEPGGKSKQDFFQPLFYYA